LELPLEVGGVAGAHHGKVISAATHTLSPDGLQWTWQQCADSCLSDASCVYFVVSKQKGCVRKLTKRKFAANTAANTILSHGTCSEAEACTTTPTPAVVTSTAAPIIATATATPPTVATSAPITTTAMPTTTVTTSNTQ